MWRRVQKSLLTAFDASPRGPTIRACRLRPPGGRFRSIFECSRCAVLGPLFSFWPLSLAVTRAPLRRLRTEVPDPAGPALLAIRRKQALRRVAPRRAAALQPRAATPKQSPAAAHSEDQARGARSDRPVRRPAALRRAQGAAAVRAAQVPGAEREHFFAKTSKRTRTARRRRPIAGSPRPRWLR